MTEQQDEPRGTGSGTSGAGTLDLPGRRGWARFRRWLGPVLALALIVLAVTVLRDITREITWSEVQAAVAAVPPRKFLESLGLAALAMGTMGLYDIISCRIARIREIPPVVAGIAGFCGYALANALGFHVILGGTVRFRIYTRHGLEARKIAQILALSLGAIVLSVVAMFAAVFIIEPGMIPLFRWAPATTQALGVALALALAGLIAWLWPGRGAITVLGWHFPVPNGPGAIGQTLLGIFDFGLAAAALYVVLPADLQPDFLPFVLIFISAFVAGALSHAPGGLGVLEAGVLLGLGAVNRPDAIAALIVFRITYFIVPFIVALISLVAMESFRPGRAWGALRRPLAITAALGVLVIGLIWLGRPA